jgi:hypothetical protein
MLSVVEIFVGMLLAVVVLALAARRFHIPYPIFFVSVLLTPYRQDGLVLPEWWRCKTLV